MLEQGSSALHVAIIMDGNGRWATARGWPRTEGHRAGAAAVERAVEAAARLGVGTLTLYAFSSDNWKRPRPEVDTLMRLFRLYLRRQGRRMAREGIRLSVIGRRDRLEPALRDAVESVERETRSGARLWLRLAVDYSGRSAIEAALGPSKDTSSLGPDVDLLIRTGGEQRLSDFLLWEAAYAELLFLPLMWPDFREDDLRNAVAAFRGRERRFGGLLPGAAAGAAFGECRPSGRAAQPASVISAGST